MRLFQSLALFLLIPFFTVQAELVGIFSSSAQLENLSEEEKVLCEKLTIITTTSPIPSHPSTEMLERTQKSLFIVPAFRGCKKIIVFDGIPSFQKGWLENYEGYKQGVMRLLEENPYFQNTTLLMLDQYYHLALSLREAMRLVDTPFVFVHQHDFELIKSFDIVHLIESMEANPIIKHVRLNRFVNQPSEHDGKIDTYVEGANQFPLKVPLLRTFAWSDNDHVSTTDYYWNFVFPKIKGKGPMEDFLHFALRRAVKKDKKLHGFFGTYIYGNLGESPYIRHLDGKIYQGKEEGMGASFR